MTRIGNIAGSRRRRKSLTAEHPRQEGLAPVGIRGVSPTGQLRVSIPAHGDERFIDLRMFGRSAGGWRSTPAGLLVRGDDLSWLIRTLHDARRGLGLEPPRSSR